MDILRIRKENASPAPVTAEFVQTIIKEDVSNVGSDFILAFKEIVNYVLIIANNAIIKDV